MQQITFSELHTQIAPEIKLRAWQIRCKNKFGSYQGGRIATPEEIAALSEPVNRSFGCLGRNSRSMTDRPAKARAAVKTFKNEQPSQHITTKADSTISKMETVGQSEHEQRPNSQWQLWTVLVFSLACSVPNMYSVALQMKDSAFLAAAITATFSLSPVLLINSRTKSAKWAAFAPIVLEVFCNTAGYYGNLTGLAHGYNLQPSQVLNMVCQMLDTDINGTGITLSLLMASAIASMSVVSASELLKHGHTNNTH